MDSRLWNDPPSKPDGTLDYSALTPREICEDLTESLLDLIENGGQEQLVPFLDECPDADDLPPDGNPSAALVDAMEQLLRLEEKEDTVFASERARELLKAAVRELVRLTDGTGG